MKPSSAKVDKGTDKPPEDCLAHCSQDHKEKRGREVNTDPAIEPPCDVNFVGNADRRCQPCRGCHEMLVQGKAAVLNSNTY